MLAKILLVLLVAACANAQVVISNAVISNASFGSAPVGGPFTFVASASGASDGSSTTVATSTTLNVAAGDLLIAVVTWEDGATTVSSLTDGGSNTLTQNAGDDISNSSNQINVSPQYRLSASSNSSATFTATLAAARVFKKLVVMQYRPHSGETVSRDISGTRENFDDTDTTNVVSGSFSTTGSDVVVCGLMGIYTSGTHSSSTIGGVSATQSKQEGGAFVWCRIVTSALTTQTANTTYSTARLWAATVLAFKAE